MQSVARLRYQNLDALRGLAIALVLIWHLPKDGFPGWTIQVTSLTWSGVDLFFVLSGFLITGILLDSRDSPGYYSRFFTRRFCRIFPAYYFLLGVLLLVPLWRPDLAEAVPAPRDSVFYWTYLANWTPLLSAPYTSTTAHLWSLSVEEQFYLVWPFFIRLIPRQALASLMCAGLVLVVIARCLTAQLSTDHEFIYRATIFRADTLLVGALAAISYRGYPAVRKWIPLAGALSAAAIGGVALLHHGIGWGSKFMESIGLTCLAAIYGWFLIALVDAENLGNPWGPWALPLRVMGRYSYGMYLYHYPMLLATQLLFGRTGPVPITGLFYLVATIALAVVSFHLMESPILSLARARVRELDVFVRVARFGG